jgi:hypothetical protein
MPSSSPSSLVKQPFFEPWPSVEDSARLDHPVFTTFDFAIIYFYITRRTRHRVPFSSPSAAHRAEVEVFEPTYTRGNIIPYKLIFTLLKIDLVFIINNILLPKRKQLCDKIN